MTKSQTEVPLTIVGAMAKADYILGSDRKWNHVNKKQELFIKKFFEPCRYDVEGIKEIESIASANAEAINDFLRKKGSNAAIDPMGRDEIGIASMLDIVVEWARKGSNVDIETPDKKKYKGVRIDKAGVWFYKSKIHNHPIASLATKTEDRVFMTMLDEEDAKGNPGEFELLDRIEKIMRSSESCFDFGGLKFPKVDLDQVEDMRWLLGINTTSSRGDPAVIKYAYQKNRLRMNEFGARFQSEFAGAFLLRSTMEIPKHDYVIDRPFLCWIKKKRSTVPLFAAYVAEKDWKDPGNINN